MARHRYQYGCLTRRNNKLSEDVWQFRFYETTPEGRRCRRSTSVGTVAQYATKTHALRVIEPLRLRLNLHHRFGRPVSVSALLDRYMEHELSERRHSTQQSHSSALNRWIRPRWGNYLLEQVKPVEVEEWLRSLPLAPKTKVNLRSLFHLIYEHAQRWELTDRNPIDLVRQRGGRRCIPRVLTPGEVPPPSGTRGRTLPHHDSVCGMSWPSRQRNHGPAVGRLQLGRSHGPHSARRRQRQSWRYQDRSLS